MQYQHLNHASMASPAKRARTSTVTAVTEAGHALVLQREDNDELSPELTRAFANFVAEFADSGATSAAAGATSAGAGGAGSTSAAAGSTSAAAGGAGSALPAPIAAGVGPDLPRCHAGAYKVVFTNVQELGGHKHMIMRPLMSDRHVQRLGGMLEVLKAAREFGDVNERVLDAGDDARLRAAALSHGDPLVKLSLFKDAVMELTKKVVPEMDGTGQQRAALLMVADKEAKRLSEDSFTINLCVIDYRKFFKCKSRACELVLENYGPHLQELFGKCLEDVRGA